MTAITRRAALVLAGAAGTGLGAGGCAGPGPDARPALADAVSSPVFRHGVASGDPDATSLVLWTRVEPEGDGPVTVRWQLAEDADFARVVAGGEVTTDAGRDFTVKAVAGGLQPGTRYAYRFLAGDAVSPTGRTMTLPLGRLDRLGIALVSCSNFAFGFFNAYDAIARDEAIDVVLHTGDYIYEYGGTDGWGHETAAAIGRTHAPAREIVTLADYRMRHAQYKRDAGSLAMHAVKPLLCCWDDHESTNNPWMGGAQNHQPGAEGDWEERRAASLQAYYEWMPIREPEAGRRREQFWRTYRFGDLATLVTLETRHTGRSEQVDYGPWVAQITTEAERDAFMTGVIGDPARTMISPEMAAHLGDGLAASVAAGEPWRLIGNASPIARMLVPDVAALGVDVSAPPPGEVPGAGANLLWKAQWNLPFYTDTWDGYPAAREALYDTAKAAGARDLLVLTGDSHSFWANRLADAGGAAMGVEIGTAGVSSPGDFVETGWAPEVAEALDRAFEAGLEEVVWTDNLHQGYVRVVLTRAHADVDYVAVDTVLSPDYRTSVLRSFRVVHRAGSLAYEGV